MTKRLFLRFIFAVQITVLLLLSFIFLSAVDLPVSDEEALSLWIVEDSAPMWEMAPRDSLRGIRANVTDMLERVEETQRAPLYPAILDGWVMLFGDSLLATRILSVLCVSLALPAMVHIIRRFSPGIPTTPAFAISLLLALPILLIVNLYGLLLLFSTASLWLLLRWRENRHAYEAVLYVVFLALTLLTAQVALPLLLLHGVIAWRGGILQQWLFAAAVGLAALLPTLLLFPLESIGVFIAPDGLQMAFVAAIVVALPVLAVALTTNMKPYGVYVNLALAVFVVGGTLLLWRSPGWRAEMEAINMVREPTAPAIMAIDPQSALGYLNRQDETALNEGISVDIGWRVFSTDELDDILTTMEDAPAIWVFLPEERPETRYVLDVLGENRTIGYDSSLENMIFRRYDR